MALINFWNLFHLHGKKVVLGLAVLCCSLAAAPAYAQSQMIVKKNLANYDDKLMHYGFYLAMPVARFNIEHSDQYVQQLADSGIAVNAKYSPNFSTGFVINFHPAEYFNIRFTPGAGFYSRSIEYEGVRNPNTNNVENVTQDVGATMIELPLLIKYTSKRRRNVRMYFVGGAKASVDVSNRKRDRIEGRLRAEPTDFSLEYGVGVDLFYPFFKFAPELRFSHGMVNMRVPDNNIYANLIQKMNSHSVTLYLFFE
ncbi:MAG: PorT family protein [Hymenobacteraceae bacterium]|nr:PorT family protein [Hymenobacteraceae bacterium]MDX5397872.1 PorT family protein [Hymenobacteraceae bacterium]MDX5443262.1 PorT family protein [Hymenobacteraceae bacterium]MDX5513943.1 PorT family protein [Hymenobacteraceae bacterium]